MKRKYNFSLYRVLFLILRLSRYTWRRFKNAKIISDYFCYSKVSGNHCFSHTSLLCTDKFPFLVVRLMFFKIIFYSTCPHHTCHKFCFLWSFIWDKIALVIQTSIYRLPLFHFFFFFSISNTCLSQTRYILNTYGSCWKTHMAIFHILSSSEESTACIWHSRLFPAN